MSHFVTFCNVPYTFIVNLSHTCHGTNSLSSSMMTTEVLVSTLWLGHGLTAEYNAVRLPRRGPSYTELSTMGMVKLYVPGLGIRWTKPVNWRGESGDGKGWSEGSGMELPTVFILQ